jgi:hypothetical protein
MQKVLILSGYFFSPVVLNPEPFNKRKKQSQMKKFLFVLAIGAFAACNNAGSDTKAADSSAVKSDSSKMSADSSKMSADSSKMAADSSKMAADTSKKK